MTNDKMAESKCIVSLPCENKKFEGARKVVCTLRGAGHEAFIVGGAVRDLLMGLTPKEYDIATSAPPEEVMKLFRRAVPVGVRFGVVTVLLLGCEYQVATYRADLGYSDGRRPDAVRFTDLREDVLRRDFTMNGLALDPETGEVFDYVGGLEDIRNGLIRTIGDPVTRFAEDRLRPLRAVRFAAQTGFEIEGQTWQAICETGSQVATVSAERIREEIGKILYTSRPGLGVRMLSECSILQAILPDLAITLHTQLEHHARTLDKLKGQPPEVLWAAFFAPLGPKKATWAALKLKHSSRMVATIRGILETAEAIEKLPDEDLAKEKRILRRPESDFALTFLEASRGPESVAYARKRKSEWTNEDMFPPKLLSGNDLITLGFAPGPRLGATLRALEDAQLRGEISDRETALHFVKSLLQTKEA